MSIKQEAAAWWQNNFTDSSLSSMDVAHAAYAAGAEGMAELQAIVAALPKCNRLVVGDGKKRLVQDCPIVPGMEITVPGRGVCEDELWEIKVTAVDGRGFITTNIGGRAQHWHCSLCFDSPEAAEFTREQADKRAMEEGNV